MPNSATLDSLWDFSLALYAQPGVADACLRLQDEAGINVNLLLWCVWLECKGIALDSAGLQDAERRIRGWDYHYVVPLRHLRRRLKAEFGSEDESILQLRKQIQQAELAAEQQVQKQLQALTRQWMEQDLAIEPVPTVAQAGSIDGKNLRRYLDGAGVNRGAVDSLLQCLMGALRSI